MWFSCSKSFNQRVIPSCSRCFVVNFRSGGSIYMVFEYMDHDLTGLMKSPHSQHFTLPQIKCYTQQLLRGLRDCHERAILSSRFKRWLAVFRVRWHQLISLLLTCQACQQTSLTVHWTIKSNWLVFKGANILIDNKGNVKLADFGLARTYREGDEYTNRVITLWYRPPELLLGQTKYGPMVDMWSVGLVSRVERGVRVRVCVE